VTVIATRANNMPRLRDGLELNNANSAVRPVLRRLAQAVAFGPSLDLLGR
jgi:hypothetical protein